MAVPDCVAASMTPLTVTPSSVPPEVVREIAAPSVSLYVPPRIVPPASVRFAPIWAVVATCNVPPVIFTRLLVTRLLIDWVPDES